MVRQSGALVSTAEHEHAVVAARRTDVCKVMSTSTNVMATSKRIMNVLATVHWKLTKVCE